MSSNINSNSSLKNIQSGEHNNNNNSLEISNNVYLGSLGYYIKNIVIENHKTKYNTCYNNLVSELNDIGMRKD